MKKKRNKVPKTEFRFLHKDQQIPLHLYQKWGLNEKAIRWIYSTREHKLLLFPKRHRTTVNILNTLPAQVPAFKHTTPAEWRNEALEALEIRETYYNYIKHFNTVGNTTAYGAFNPINHKKIVM